MDNLAEQYEANAALVEQRLSMGDLAERPRPLDHLAYFPKKAVDAAANDLSKAGFQITNVKKGLRRALVEFSRSDAADLDSVNASTRQILEIVSNHGGTYDGWASFLGTEPSE